MRRMVLLVSALLATPALAQSGDGFVAGYASALLAERYPELGLSVAAGRPDGAVTLTGSACLEDAERERVAEDLMREWPITAVQWALPCEGESTAVAERAPPAARTLELVALPQTPVFAPLRADPREPQFSARYQRLDIDGETINAGDVSFGGYFPIAEGTRGDTSYQVGLQGAVFALFNLDAPSNDLINADYWIGVPYSIRRGRWSARVRLYHQSSHLGDEFLLRNPDIERINLSYEELDALLAYRWRALRIYGGGGLIVHSEPELDPGHVQYGVEYERPGVLTANTRLILSANLERSDTQDWSPNRSYRAGLALTRRAREISLFVEHYDGFSPSGQFYTYKIEYTGIGFALEL